MLTCEVISEVSVFQSMIREVMDYMCFRLIWLNRISRSYRLSRIQTERVIDSEFSKWKKIWSIWVVLIQIQTSQLHEYDRCWWNRVIDWYRLKVHRSLLSMMLEVWDDRWSDFQIWMKRSVACLSGVCRFRLWTVTVERMYLENLLRFRRIRKN